VTAAASARAFAPGKVILLGEHAVVYGHAALAGPLSWGVTAQAVSATKATLDIPKAVKGPGRELLLKAFARAAKRCGGPRVRVSLQSELPVSMGLGSSAAVSVALARLLLESGRRPASPERVRALALEMEEAFHGTPSGIDHTVSALDELILYRRAAPRAKPQVKKVASPKPLKVVVALAGARSATRVTVGALRERQALWPRRYRRLFDQMGQVAKEGARAVAEGDLQGLGDAMNVNHGLLAAAGLSSGNIDALVHTLRSLGALGAKLTGAGGDGGSVVGLFVEPERALARLTQNGVFCFESQIAGPKVL
jgi:mevalonate kinase